MTEYLDFKTRHVAALILIEARKGIRPPVIRNVRAEHYIRGRGSAFPGHFYKVVEE